MIAAAPAAHADTFTLSPDGERPSVAVDAQGAAHVVWTEHVSGSADVLHYCRVPRGAGGCDVQRLLVPPEPSPQYNLDPAGPRVVLTGPSDVSILTFRYPNVITVDSHGTPDPDCATHFPPPSQECYSSSAKTWIYRSSDGGATFGAPHVFSHVPPSGQAVAMPSVGGPSIATITDTQSGGTFFASARPDGYTRTSANVGNGGSDRAYGGTVAALGDGRAVTAFTDLSSNLYVRQWGGVGSADDVGTWPPALRVDAGQQPHLAAGPSGTFLLYRPQAGDPSGAALVLRRWTGGALEGVVPVSDPGSLGDADLFEDGSGGVHAAWVRRDGLADVLRYRASPDGIGFGGAVDAATGAPSSMSDIGIGVAADGRGWAVWSSTQSGHSSVAIAPLGGPPPPAPPPPPPPPAPTPQPGVDPPRNTASPSIEAGVVPRLYTCNEGTWTGSPSFTYEWYRVRSLGRGAVLVGRDPGYRITRAEVGGRFFCRVTATNAGGSATAASPVTILSGTPAVPPFPPRKKVYGNVRIRGIDLFQVVQPTAGAPMFGFPDGGFPGMAGGGTSTNWRGGILSPLHLEAGTTAQSVVYQGVPLDDGKPTTAVVYVDMEGAAPTDTSLALDVTLIFRVGGVEYTRITRQINNPPVSTTPFVTEAERDDPNKGVQFAVPQGLLWHAAEKRMTVEARVALPVGETATGLAECTDRACGDDDRFVLSGVPVGDMPSVWILPVALQMRGQAAFPAPRTVLARALQLWPGGEQAVVPGYVGTADITFEATRSLADHECTDLKFETVRSCRMYLVETRLMTWRWDAINAGSPEKLWDVILGVHSYQTLGDADAVFTEPGWTSGSNGTKLDGYTSGFAKPLFTATASERPLTAAAHEYGHVLSAPHADLTCGGNDKGQTGEPWPPDDRGRHEGVRWDPKAPLVGGQVDPAVDTSANQVYDLMSYCAAEANAWLSARNWNRAFQVLEGFRQRRTRAVTRHGLARVASTPRSLVTGLVTAGGGRITNVRRGDGDEPAIRDDPASPVRLRALAADGGVLADVGVELQTLEGSAGDARAFEATVPATAAQVVLLRDGVELHRTAAGRPPTVALRAPHAARKAGLDVRWSASDPDGGSLQATVEFSPDAGRTWRTVYDGPSTGRLRVPANRLSSTRRAVVRVTVSDGFDQARATSKSFVAEGPPPQVTIAAPTGREPLVAGDRVSLSGSAIDDRLRPVSKRSLTWYDGRRRIGSGSEVTTRLHAGRHVLRLVARDATGHTAQARRTVRVARAPLRLLDLRAPERVRGGVRRLKVRIAASAAAVVRGAGGHRYRIGTKLSTVELMLPRRPAVGVLSVPLVVRAADPDTRGSVRETLLVLRIGR